MNNAPDAFATELAKSYETLTHRAEVDDLRQATAAKRRAMWADALRYDAPLKDENGDEQEDRSLSDCGKGAELIYQLGRQSEWFEAMDGILDTLTGVDRDVVNALFVDLRPQVAARLAGVNRQRVYRVIARLRKKLAPAHNLWQARND